MLKSLIILFGKTVFPTLYWRMVFNKQRKNFNEKEMYLLPTLCDKNKTSIDIGAAQGVYIVNMVPYSKKICAFEPIPKNVEILNTITKYLHADVEIIPVALSNKEGSTELRIVENDLGRSTIEEENKLESGVDDKKTAIAVPIKTLDSFDFGQIGLIKIDVEGHELSVLHGAEQTIVKNKPSFLIEIEERHKNNAISEVNDFLTRFGYSGYFLADDIFMPLEKFDLETHQDPKNIGDASNHYKRFGIYINNFIFLQPENVAKAEAAFRKIID